MLSSKPLAISLPAALNQHVVLCVLHRTAIASSNTHLRSHSRTHLRSHSR
jgi:hypothetical protein